MSEKSLQGYVTFSQIAAYLNISTETLRQKMEPLRPMLANSGKRKRLYSPNEWKFVLKHLEAE